MDRYDQMPCDGSPEKMSTSMMMPVSTVRMTNISRTIAIMPIMNLVEAESFVLKSICMHPSL